MYKTLIVGDPHIKISNLKEATKLVDFIVENAKKHDPKFLIILGDLFHTHSIKRLEVENFWIEAFQKLIPLTPHRLIVLVGNHDIPGSNETMGKINALKVFGEQDIDIIDKPTGINNIALIPYMRDKQNIIKESKRLYDSGCTKLLITHNTFTGAKYETGFYAPEGIEPELICQDQIISGHIHLTQEIGKCFYPGSVMWDKMSDANHNKGIWILEHNDDNSIAKKTFLSTEDVVTPIYKLTIKEGDPEPEIKPNARVYLEFHGKNAWIKKMKKKYKGKAGIKGVPTDRRAAPSKSNDKINLLDFLKTIFVPIKTVAKDDIATYLEALNASK